MSDAPTETTTHDAAASSAPINVSSIVAETSTLHPDYVQHSAATTTREGSHEEGSEEEGSGEEGSGDGEQTERTEHSHTPRGLSPLNISMSTYPLHDIQVFDVVSTVSIRSIN